MNELTKQLLFEAWNYCDKHDKSTEFMLTYMSDVANVDYMDVIEFISSEPINEERLKQLNENDTSAK